MILASIVVLKGVISIDAVQCSFPHQIKCTSDLQEWVVDAMMKIQLLCTRGTNLGSNDRGHNI
jgi:hypothetical protein